MNIALYGGSFNPPHKGHRLAAKAIHAQLKPDLLLIMPNRTNPSKQEAKSFPTPEQRLELCALAFDGLPRTQVSDLEVRREGPTYTADTIGELSRLYPGCRITLVLGSDMLENLPNWARFEEFSKQCSFAVLLRYADRTETVHRRIAELQQSCGIEISCVENRILEMGSFSIRQQLAQRGGRDCLRGSVYARIIQQRYYDALPELAWLREQAYEYLKKKRIPHVQGCEEEAVRLALRYGSDPAEAAEAAILHDITKKLSHPEQLEMCRHYGLANDAIELQSPALMHAKTGAAFSRDLFGVPDRIYDAILYHTTGRPKMTLLEKIIYLADFIEPTRDFPGVEPLRELCYKDINQGMELGLRMSLEHIRSGGEEPYITTRKAQEYYEKLIAENKGETLC